LAHRAATGLEGVHSDKRENTTGQSGYSAKRIGRDSYDRTKQEAGQIPGKQGNDRQDEDDATRVAPGAGGNLNLNLIADAHTERIRDSRKQPFASRSFAARTAVRTRPTGLNLHVGFARPNGRDRSALKHVRPAA
jgi:hypothetical protein